MVVSRGQGICAKTVAMPTEEQRTLRQMVATLAYRAAKALRDAPPSFATYSCGSSSRTPVRIVAHMADLMSWGVSIAKGGYVWRPEGSDDWNGEIIRFYRGLAELDAALAEESFSGSVDKLIQGPLADALTHVGQLSLMRGMAGCPVRPESYAKAPIAIGRVGLDQEPPRAEFDGDASQPTQPK